MTYFTHKDHEALTSNHEESLQKTRHKLSELHKLLYRRLRELNYDLHPQGQPPTLVSSRSAASMTETECLLLSYMRSREQIKQVERAMGREGFSVGSEEEIYRHPVIEVRLSPHSFAVELVVSPFAWWDQQNFVGKLYVPRHRDTFRSILQRMDGDFRFGFWEGIELKDMHLTTYQLIRTNHLNDWTNTFADGKDWLRMGVWYEPEDPALDPGSILKEVTRRIGGLHNFYTFTLWTSNNDFQPFYQRMTRSSETRM